MGFYSLILRVKWKRCARPSSQFKPSYALLVHACGLFKIVQAKQGWGQADKIRGWLYNAGKESLFATQNNALYTLHRLQNKLVSACQQIRRGKREKPYVTKVDWMRLKQYSAPAIAFGRVGMEKAEQRKSSRRMPPHRAAMQAGERRPMRPCRFHPAMLTFA